MNVSRVYGVANPSFTLSYSGFVSGEGVANLTTQPTASTAATTASASGTYSITVSGGSAANYAFSYTAGTLTITSTAQTIVFDTIAGKTYGDAAFAVNATASSGLGVSYRIVSGPATISGSTLTITGAGTVVVEASQAGDANYAGATAVQQSFIVAPKALTVTAANATRIVGAANPSFTLSYAGFVSGESASNLTTAPTASTTATTSSAAGTYPIAVSGGSAANYTFSYVAGTLTVTSSAQTITFNPIATKTYGDAAFALDATASSGLAVTYRIVSGPATVSGSTLTITGAGTVVVEANQAGDSINPAATPAQQSFVVSPRTLTVRAGDASRAYGAANPSFSVWYSSGLVPGDGAGNIPSWPTATTTATTASAPGTYPITVSGGSAPNYTFSYIAGTLTITPVVRRSQTIEFNYPPDRTYGGPPFPLSAYASSGLPVSFRVVSGPATITGRIVTLTGAGLVQVVAEQGGNDTYDAAPSVTRMFAVGRGSQRFTSFTVTPMFSGAPGLGAKYQLAATVSSGLPISYSVMSGSATISGTTLTVTGLKPPLIVRASQNGDFDYDTAWYMDKEIELMYAPTLLSINGGGTVNPGATVTLTAVGKFDSFSTLQWTGPKGVIAGATGSTLILKNVTVADGGTYTLSITNAIGSVSAATKVDLITQLAKIQSSPSAQTYYVGRKEQGPSVTFGVNYDSSTPATLIWRKDGKAIPGAIAATLSYVPDANEVARLLAQAKPANSVVAGLFDVVITNAAGSVTSTAVPLTLFDYIGNLKPHFTVHPKSTHGNVRESVTFSATIGPGSPKNRVEWWFSPRFFTDDAPIDSDKRTYQQYSVSEYSGGERTFTLTLPNLIHYRSGDYKVIVRPYDLLATDDASFGNPVASLSVGSEPATLVVPKWNLAGYYSGKVTVKRPGGFAIGTPWSVTLGPDNTGNMTIIVTIFGIRIPAVFPVWVDNDGRLTITGLNIIVEQLKVSSAPPGGRATARAVPDTDPGPDFSKFVGTFGDDGVLTAGFTGDDTTSATATRADATGETRAYAGFYAAGTQGASAQTFMMVGPNNEVIVASSNGDYGVGTIDASGKLNVVTTANRTIAGSISADTAVLAATVASSTGDTTTISGVSSLSDGGVTQRLVNLSGRTTVGQGSQVAIAGFVVGGVDDRNVLIRAVGPGLATYGVANPLLRPKLQVFAGDGTLVATNIGWSTAPNPDVIAVAASSAGAFALNATSADSALYLTLPAGAYTAVVSDAGTAGGVALTEIYDLTEPLAGQKLLNSSIRGTVGGPNNALIAGVVVGGSAAKRILVRAAGPGLNQFGLAGLAQPKITLMSGDKVVAETSGGWSTSPDVTAIDDATKRIGAFNFASGSADAAMIINLSPGPYTAIVTGLNGTVGTALLEFYDAP